MNEREQIINQREVIAELEKALEKIADAKIPVTPSTDNIAEFRLEMWAWSRRVAHEALTQTLGHFK